MAVEILMANSSQVILGSTMLAWIQPGLSMLTRAGRGTLVKFHQPTWQGS